MKAFEGQTPAVLATLCNGLLNLVRQAGWTNIADALGTYGASLSAAPQLLGVIAIRLI